jgi:hypothetical protein
MDPMSEHTKLFERAAARYEVPDLPMADLVKRRDRKRRNQRIAAGVVGIAVFVAAIWVVTSVSSLDRSETSVVPGGDVTGPAVSPGPEPGPQPDPYGAVDDFGFIVLPPEGATPSSPENGNLVLYFSGRGIAAGRALTHIFVYADGRLIWSREGQLPQGANEPNTGFFEQRLTPEGVELMRSEVISSGLFECDDLLCRKQGLPFMVGGDSNADPLAFWGEIVVVNDGDQLGRLFGWNYLPSEGDVIATPEQENALAILDARLTNPASWLPASAWADQEIRAYVPSRYKVCYGGFETETIERERVLNALPGPAEELLRAEDAEPNGVGGQFGQPRVTIYCSDLPTEDARVVIRALDEAGVEREQINAEATFDYQLPLKEQTVSIYIDPYVPGAPHNWSAGWCIPCG